MKKVRLTESQLVDLIQKVVKENTMVGAHGFKQTPTEGMTPETKEQITKDNTLKSKTKEKSTAQKYYDKIISTKNELEKLNDNLNGEKNAVIKNIFGRLEKEMKQLQELLAKRDDVNKM